MARYTIKYLDGDTETLQADNAEYDVDARLFTFHSNPKPVALVPGANVRSVTRHGDEAVDA